ncbi:uncharacterized protein ColSpa_12561 [Colletotrichum spaethianum]|uniref:Uncharacterized protein n=1 Tax=Colletotrichum spaethianum TaxID=700344 RepID=A0AA37UQF3_9PEZI|nr:uncharacterized protein ColSpa_12561 [Colletotrichum spaethianum]GKT52380.1 hypothetical protein ColSpa_12561 [Colletotrichum spaethianum]
MFCGRIRATHESNMRRHIKNCGQCQSEIQRQLDTERGLRSPDAVTRNTTNELLKSYQKAQQRTPFKNGIPFGANDLDQRYNSLRIKTESDLCHTTEFPHVDATREPGLPVSLQLQTRPDSDHRSLGAGHLQISPAEDALKYDTQHEMVGVSGAEFEQFHLSMTGDTPNSIPAGCTSMPFFDEAFWTQRET